ncbi:MAG: fibronectin type III domain-containing protein, partial [Coriobacteriales bacterium]|nr:fibronectin type III domain-containing protein [Coriobacteriales bacterium]
MTHTHDFTYSANGATITATCTADDCPLPPSSEGGADHVATLTIAATGGTYNGTIAFGATITDANGIKGDAKVQYQKKTGSGYGAITETAPTDAGDYRASITVGGATASVDYAIAKADIAPTVSIEGWTYGDVAKAPGVVGNTGGGEVAYAYAAKGTTAFSGTVPTNAGDYTVRATVGATDNYNGGEATADFSIARADQDAPALPAKASATTTSITLEAIANGEYKMGDGAWQESPVFSGLAMDTEYTFRQRLRGDANHNVSPESQPAGIRTSNHAHEWSYAARGAAITATCGNTDGGHGSPLTATLTIVRPPLTIYGGDEEEAAELDGLIDFNAATGLGVSADSIQYYKATKSGGNYVKGNVLAAASANAGDYVAEITLTGVKTSAGDNQSVTASVGYTIAPQIIGSVEVTDITAPVATEALDTVAATSTEHVSIGNSGAVAWSPAHAKAAYATVYEATVTAAADTNYAFADGATATVNEQPATVARNRDGTLAISYTFDRTALAPVTIGAADKTATYSAVGITIPVKGMFTITKGAGAATYSVANGTGEGVYDKRTGKLTVTRCGTFTVSVSTAASDTHAAGAETSATLTVNKAAPTVTAPTARTLTYDGQARKLVAAGEAVGGAMQYALGTDATTAPADNLYAASIPTATDAGTYRVWYRVAGDDNHLDAEPASVSVTIGRADVSKAKVTLARASYVYNDKAREPRVKSVVLGGRTLKSGADYSVSYKGNVKPGTAKAIVTGTGNYRGTAKATFSIVPAKVTGLTTAGHPAKGTLDVAWEAAAGAKAYQLSWRKAGGKWKTMTAKGTSATIEGLKAGGLYELRVRARAGSATGAWSKVAGRWLSKASSL